MLFRQKEIFFTELAIVTRGFFVRLIPRATEQSIFVDLSIILIKKNTKEISNENYSIFIFLLRVLLIL